MTDIYLSEIISGKQDIEKIVRWLNNEKLMRFSEQRHKFHTTDSEIEYIRSIQPPDKFWAIHCGTRLIGTAVARVDPMNHIADLGILIGEPGRGFGRIAWDKCIEKLFQDSVDKVEAGCMITNAAMMKICLNSGMLLEGTRKRHFLYKGERTDMVMWGKCRECPATHAEA